MSDVTSVTVPVAGWYPDRNDAAAVRWWDGGQWTEHTQCIAPEQNVAQPVSAAAFGFTPVEPNPVEANPVAAMSVPTTVQTAGQPAPGWYPDNADRSIQRWWDGTQWTAHTAPGAALPTASPTPGSYLGAYATPVAPAINTMASRGMLYSLIGLVLNPLLIMSIGGLVLGIRGLRRVPQFAPENARRGSAITAIVVGAVATVLSLVLVGAAIAIPAIQSQQPQFINQSRVQQQLLQDLSSRFNENVASVSCPATTVVKKGNTFECTATLPDGETMQIVGTFATDAGDYDYVLHEPDSSGDATTAEAPTSGDSGGDDSGVSHS